MRPLTWILLGGGALVVIAGIVEAVTSSPAAASSAPGGGAATKLLPFTGGHRATVTVTLAGPITGSGTTKASVQAALPSNYTVQSVSATPTTIELVVDAAQSAAEHASVFLSAAQAPAGSTAAVVDNGPTPGGGAKGAGPQTFALDASANGTTVQAKVGDTISIGLLTLSGGTPWSYSYSGPAVTQGKETSSTAPGASASTQTDVFNAAGPGTSVISAHDGGGQKFSVTVVVS